MACFIIDDTLFGFLFQNYFLFHAWLLLLLLSIQLQGKKYFYSTTVFSNNGDFTGRSSVKPNIRESW